MAGIPSHLDDDTHVDPSHLDIRINSSRCNPEDNINPPLTSEDILKKLYPDKDVNIINTEAKLSKWRRERRGNKRKLIVAIMFFSIGILGTLLLFLALPIVNIIIAVKNTDDMCQDNNSIELTLSSWLLGMGIIVISTLIINMLIKVSCINGSIKKKIFHVLEYLYSLIIIIYTILGAVILFASNKGCLKSENSLGVLSLINLILYWILIIFVILSKIYIKIKGKEKDIESN